MYTQKFFDRSYRIGDDFYKFCTGKWLDYYPMPEEYSSWNCFSVLEENQYDKLKQVIDSLEPANKEHKAVLDYWHVMTDYERRNSEGNAPMIPYIDELMRKDSKDDVLKYLIEELGIEFGICVGIGPDEENSEQNEVYVSQNLSLDNKEYYLSSDKKKVDILNKYRETYVKILMKAGYTEEQSCEIMDVELGYETELAVDCYSVEDLERPELNYFMMGIDELSDEVKFDMRKYLSWHGLNETEKLIVCQPGVVKKHFELIDDMTLDELKVIGLFEIVANYCGSLSEDYGELKFEFTKFLTGVKKRQDKWKRELNNVDGEFSDIIGRRYAELFLNDDAKKTLIDMFEYIRRAFRMIIKSQSWMSDETKEVALEKLNSMTYKIGYPDKWEDYSDLEIDPEDNLLTVGVKLGKYWKKRNIVKRYNKPVDKEEWPMVPHEINACYMTLRNEFCFPCGILQEPFFCGNESMAENFGAIGVILGHEMTHGFDTSGSQYDKNGNMCQWWKKEDRERFEQQTVPTRKRFEGLEVLPGLKCNSELTIDENIADFGGLNVAYLAYKLWREDDRELGDCDDEFSDIQRFFIKYAVIWSGTETEECAYDRTMNNTHSLNRMRVNGTLPMMNEWYEAFPEIGEGDKLWVKPEERGKIWTLNS